MATIRKRGNKFQVQVRRAGFQSATKSFERLTEAKAWARQCEILFDQGEAGNQKPARIKLADVLRRYLKEVTPAKKSAAGETRRINHLLKDKISSTFLSDLSAKKLANFRDRRIKDGVRTAAYDLQIIRHALNIGCSEWGIYLKANPVEQIRLPRPPKPRERRLRTDEYDSLLFHAKGSRSHYMYPLIILAVATALRVGEILKLEWSDLDKENRLLTLRDTKNGDSRVVPLSPTAFDVLGALPKNDATLFGTNYHAVKSAWRRLCKRAGINDLRIHDLRREGVSQFFEKGLTLPEVAMLSGHKTKAQVLRYAHSDFSNIVEKLAR